MYIICRLLNHITDRNDHKFKLHKSNDVTNMLNNIIYFTKIISKREIRDLGLNYLILINKIAKYINKMHSGRTDL